MGLQDYERALWGRTHLVPDPRLPDPGRWSTARNLLRAAFTVPPFLVQHLWRRTRVDEVTRTVDAFSEAVPDPAGIDGTATSSEVQAAIDGNGPLVMRTYQVRIVGASLPPDELMARLIARPGELNDDRIAGFVVDDQPATDLTPGDDLVVELPGPWNAPVRVSGVDADTLLLQTLDGHMEAGQIRFDVTDHAETTGEHDFTFRIRSWARGGDPAFTILHLRLRVAKELQTAMWVAMCEGAVRVAGGERDGAIGVVTEILADSAPDDDGVVVSALEATGDRS